MSVRIVAARHDACGSSTRVRLPSAVPARAVHRLRCDHCEQAFEIGEVDDFGLESELKDLEKAVPLRKRAAVKRPSLKLPKKLALPKLTRTKLEKPKISLPKIDPQSRTWRLATIPVAAVLVIGGLLLLQGGGDDSPTTASTTDGGPPSVVDGDDLSAIPPATAGDQTGSPTTPANATAPDGGTGTAAAGNTANLVAGTTYSLALPKGWERTDPPSGATFAAAAPNGEADATLWVTRDPNLDFPTFVSQSMAQLEALAGSADIVERVPAPTEEGTIVKLAANAPEGEPAYAVTLRVSGDYRYYLATTVQPEASPEAVQAADLIAGSFTPEAKG